MQLPHVRKRGREGKLDLNGLLRGAKHKAKTKRVSVGEVLFKAPGATVGLLISIFPLSIPVFYLVSLLFME